MFCTQRLRARDTVTLLYRMAPKHVRTPAALVEADIARFERVIGCGRHSRTDKCRTTEVAIAVRALNRMLDLGRPEYARTMGVRTSTGLTVPAGWSMQRSPSTSRT